MVSASLVLSALLAAEFSPPGPNIALHKPYTLEPAPNYGDCADPGDATQLTDGVYTEGYFWVQPSTVGWVHTHPVVITIDLGQVEPIAGLSYSTAAGVADVTWPTALLAMVSDDGKLWTAVGDLVELSNRSGAPPPTPYQTHRFVTGDLRTRGRYVALVVDCTPYTVVDEVEVFRGDETWLESPPEGPQTTDPPLQYSRSQIVLESIRFRLRTDLDAIMAAPGAADLDQADALRAAIAALDVVPEDFTTVLPLNELHERIYTLNAPILRARGYRGLTVWSGHRYDPLQPLYVPAEPPPDTPTVRVRMMRNEHRAEVINLTNATDEPLTAMIRPRGLGRYARALTLRPVVFTDTRDRIPIGSALGTAATAERGLRLTVPAGTTQQVWLAFDSRDVPSGDVRAWLEVTGGGADPAAIPLALHVADAAMPDEFSLAIGGWDETNGRGGYDVTAENMAPLIAKLRDYGVNMPWSNPQVVPTPGEYDAEGNLTSPPDFAAWDEWVARWPGVPHWGVFASVSGTFAGEPMGTPRLNRMVGAWVTTWVGHAKTQGIEPGQIKLLLVDEARSEEQDRVIIPWARAIHAAQRGLVIWNDPVHPDPAQADPELYAQSDVLCPNAPRFLGGGQAYQDFFVAQQRAGRELWFYSCSGPAKLLDPSSYYRGQFWLNIRYGGKGSCYWAFGDEAGGSWNAYVQPRTAYSPLFLSKTDVTDAKQMEAIREGAEDYEYFEVLRARVAELERNGVRGRLLGEARTLLVAGPQQVVATLSAGSLKWAVPKDRATMDRVRLRALELLERLEEPSRP